LGIYGDYYSVLVKNEKRILEPLEKEENEFQKALTNGEREIEKHIERVNEGQDWLANSSKVYALEMALKAVSENVSDKEALGVFNKSLRPTLNKLRGEYQEKAAEMDVEVPAEVREHAERLKGNWKLRGDRAFYYFESYGFPLEMTVEMMAERGIKVDEEGFEKAFEQHQAKSREGAEQKFAGGLADHSWEVRKLHTTTHLMLEALRRVLGDHVEQRGSNITHERLRFDFSHDQKVTPEQLAKVEKIVNEAIKADHPVTCEEMSVQDARGIKATGIFVDKYETELEGKVKVYIVADYSKEICGGPHVEHTGQLEGTFKIVKEESSSAGVRRIKAVLKNPQG